MYTRRACFQRKCKHIILQPRNSAKVKDDKETNPSFSILSLLCQLSHLSLSLYIATFRRMDVTRLLTPYFTPSGKNELDTKKWPSCYPPNQNPRAETKSGKLSNRDHLPLLPFTLSEYQSYGACDTRIKELIYEDTNTQRKQGEARNVIHRVTKLEQDLYFSFGSCNMCYRSGLRKFGDSEITPYPGRVSSKHPCLPQVGLCGCVLCNACVNSVVDHPANRNEWFVHCPYCGNLHCFSKHYKIWAVSDNVFKKEKVTRQFLAMLKDN
jgi:hypothetical protein